MSELSTHEQLRAKFDPKDIKKNAKNQHYASIDQYIGRLNDVLGLDWDLNIVNSSLTESERLYGTKHPKPGYFGQVTVALSVTVDGNFTTRYGVGADFADDPDKVIKTALAEALKKACHQFGVASYLWIEEERDAIDAVQNRDIRPLMKQLADRAKAVLEVSKVNKSDLADFYAVEVTTLDDYDAVEALLKMR